MQEMVCDALRQHETFETPNSNKEPPNEDTQRFYNLLVRRICYCKKRHQTQNYQHS